MSNEFFFDDEVDEKKPVKKGSNKKSDSAKKPVSNKSDSNVSAPTKSATLSQGIQPMFVVAIAVIALFVGIIGGILVGKQIAPKVTYTQADVSGTGSSTSSGMSAATGGAISPSSSSSSTTK
ncbi:MAG: hypothetical protein JJE36_00920 [Coriobacteriia bacterium]|nr:hypothetical protein [Coriobacteriia bacterium]